jgi:hypothetical protein
MTQPQGFKVKGQEHKVCKLVKALYGLKQAPRARYSKIDEYLRKVGFQRSESNDTLYFRMKNNHLVILVIYVDDLIIMGNNEVNIKRVKEELHASFKMKYLGPLHYYPRIEVTQHTNQIFLSQTVGPSILRNVHSGEMITFWDNFVRK